MSYQCHYTSHSIGGISLTRFHECTRRTTGLLKSGGLKETPLWYDVYRKYPPDLEPYAERPIPPQDPILEIVYEEDFDRARDAKKGVGDKQRKRTRTVSSKIPHHARKPIMEDIVKDVSDDK